MTTRISPRDFERLSAYLDGQFQGMERQRLEARLTQDPALRSELEDLRRMRVVLHSIPRRKAPRNFTLTEKMVGQRPKPAFRLYPVMGFASALASLLFVLVVLGDFLGFISPQSGGTDSQTVQEAAPLALVVTSDETADAGLQMKSAPPSNDSAVLPEAETGVAMEDLQAPTEEQGEMLLQMAPVETAAPGQETQPPVVVGEEATLPHGAGGGVITVTQEASLRVEVTAQPTEEMAAKELGQVQTPTPTLTFTPTPMPTETPVYVLLPTFTPTPMPTETPLPSSTAEPVALVQPEPSPTQVVVAMDNVREPTEAAPIAESLPVAGPEAEDFLPEEPPVRPASFLRPLVLVQIGLFLLAVMTGLAALFLRFRQR